MEYLHLRHFRFPCPYSHVPLPNTDSCCHLRWRPAQSSVATFLQRKRKMFYWLGYNQCTVTKEPRCKGFACKCLSLHFVQCISARPVLANNSLTQWSVKLIVAAAQLLQPSPQSRRHELGLPFHCPFFMLRFSVLSI